jgi:glucose/arabinose dehydrogenase
MIAAMWSWVPVGLLALVFATQTVQTRACPDPPPSPSPGPSPAPSPSPSPAPSPEVFTTQDGIRFRVETVAAGLTIPWSIVFTPDGRLFVTERPGRVRIVNIATGASELALTVDGVFAQGEAGALGMALDPQFAQNGFVYLYHSATGGSGAVNRVVRYRDVANRLVERVVLLDNVPAAGIHDGGRIRFGPDGLLYVTVGDAANMSLPQDLGSLAGKILRITRTGTVPPGNPFGASPVYSWGHRNPQGIDWHPQTGDLWASEHGATGNDEINVIRAGVNYGWPTIQGGQTMAGMERPIVSYSPSIAPSGASFYRGDRFPGFRNNLFVAALAGQLLLRVRVDGRQFAGDERLLDDRFGRLRDVVTGPDGNLYVLTNEESNSRIIRLVPAG